jgi:hypothetical protein
MVYFRNYFKNQPAKPTSLKMPEWMDVLSVEEERLFLGKRIAWLPVDEFGANACLVVGILLLDNRLALSNAIRSHCQGVWLNDNTVLVRGILRQGNEKNEYIIAGELNKDEPQRTQLENYLSKNDIQSIDVCIEFNSGAVGLMETTDSRDEFEVIWRQYSNNYS